MSGCVRAFLRTTAKSIIARVMCRMFMLHNLAYRFVPDSSMARNCEVHAGGAFQWQVLLLLQLQFKKTLC